MQAWWILNVHYIYQTMLPSATILPQIPISTPVLTFRIFTRAHVGYSRTSFLLCWMHPEDSDYITSFFSATFRIACEKVIRTRSIRNKMKANICSVAWTNTRTHLSRSSKIRVRRKAMWIVVVAGAAKIDLLPWHNSNSMCKSISNLNSTNKKLCCPLLKSGSNKKKLNVRSNEGRKKNFRNSFEMFHDFYN